MAIVRWILALAIGGFLLMFGVTKFTGGAHIFPYIEYKATALGFPMADLFFPLVNYATGALELVAGALIILPMTRKLGSFLAVLPFAGATAFHLSPLLGVVTPAAFSDPKPVAALTQGGPFEPVHFSAETTPALFALAAGFLVLSLINAALNRR